MTDDDIRAALAEVAKRPDAPTLRLNDFDHLLHRAWDYTSPKRCSGYEPERALLRLIAAQHVAEKARTARLVELAAKWDKRRPGLLVNERPTNLREWRVLGCCADELRAAMEER